MHEIDDTWKLGLAHEFESPYFSTLSKKVEESYAKKIVFPPREHVWNAFELCSLDSLSAVIIGQDPYHGKEQAHGLAFSVQEGVRLPPSLKNIFKEIHNDVGVSVPESGNLERWAKQGVLLLNTTLTVEESKPNSHADFGWSIFTDAVIQKISDEKEHVVFMLWGKHAQNKSSLIDGKKHLILKAPHPSPFSAYTGFFGCGHFSKANVYLRLHGKSEILW